MSYEGLYDFLLFCFNVDFNFRLHRVIGNHQQTQMTALLAYISNYLNNVLGTTFFDYVNQYRLSYAEQLLRQTKMSIEEIADRSGFNSRSTFRRAFLKRFGCAPSHYRLQHLPKEIEKEISLTQ